MRPAASAAFALFLGVGVGCMAPEEQPSQRAVPHGLTHRPRAVHAHAKARDFKQRAIELDRETVQQAKLLQELILLRQDLFRRANYARHFKRGDKALIEIEARNLEGEARRLGFEIKNRTKVLRSLRDRASWYHRQARTESRRQDEILRNPTSVELMADQDGILN